MPAALGLMASLPLAALAAGSREAAEVLVVGAGQAGMAAAHRLAALGHSVHVLEATDHVGGRTRNVDVATGAFDVATDDVMEVGGTWLSPAHTATLQLCSQLGLEVFNASFAGKRPSGRPGGRREAPGAGADSFPWWFWGSDYPEEQLSGLGQTVFHASRGRFLYRTPSELLAGLGNETVEQLRQAGELVVAASDRAGTQCWQAQGVSAEWLALDADSTLGTLQGPLRSQEARQVLRNCIHGKNAQEPEAVSFLYNTLSFRGCNSAGPDSQFRVRGGTQAIPLAIAKRLAGNISLGAAVETVSATGDGVRVRTRDGREFGAKVAIVTGSPPAMLGIRFDPPLPGPQAQLLQRMPMGTSMKFAAVYREGPWWRELGLQGDILSTALPPELSLPLGAGSGPLFVQCVDHSPFSRRLGVIACFVEGRQNLHVTALPAEEQQRLLRAFLRLSFNDSRAETLQPTFVAHNWADQPFARGAYTNYFPPGVLSIPEFWAAYQEMEKLPNLLLAGSDYHTGFGNGYIEGAIRDGQLAAERAAERLRRRRRDREGGHEVVHA